MATTDDGERLFEGPERAVRAAHRVHERLRRRRFHGQGGPPAFFGVVFLLMGALFLLDNLDVIDGRGYLRTFWPALFVGWGLTRLWSGARHRFLPLLAIGVGTVLLGNRLLGWGIDVARLFWPAVLIVLGAHILYRSWRRPPRVEAAGDRGAAAGPAAAFHPDADPDVRAGTSSTFDDSAFLGAVERRHVSQAFRGGRATAVIGAVEIDLRDCQVAGETAIVDVSVMMGAVEIRIPREWTVESRVSAMLGAFEDGTDRPVDPAAKRLVVRGSAFMGAIEIRN